MESSTDRVGWHSGKTRPVLLREEREAGKQQLIDLGSGRRWWWPQEQQAIIVHLSGQGNEYGTWELGWNGTGSSAVATAQA